MATASATAAQRRDLSPARLWRDFSLSLTFGALFLLSFIGHTYTGWMQYAADQQSHDEPATVFGDSGYVWYWGEWTLQNWQSEFLEVAAMVVLSSFLIHKGSAESKDGDDEIKEILTKIEDRLAKLEDDTSPSKD